MKKNRTANPGSTIYDVATLAQVSTATVSRYLNTPDQLNEETRLKVREAVNRLTYVPRGNAGSIVRRDARRVGVLTPFFPAPSFAQRLLGITSVLGEAHCETVLYPVNSPSQLTGYLHTIPFAKRLDGLIVMSMKIEEEDAQRLAASGLEVILVEQQHPLLCSVEADNVHGGALAAKHLLEKNYFPVGFIGERTTPRYSLHPSQRRWQGFQSALSEAGHSVSALHVRLGEGTVADGSRMGLELLKGENRPRSIFAMSDLLAIGLVRAARSLNLRVPEDLAIVGFDDIEAAEFMDLTTISQSLEESGRVAAELVLSRIRQPGRPLQMVQLKVSVVPRGTT